MKIFKEGDPQTAICNHCGQITTGHYALRNLISSETEIVIKNILALVCDNCGTTIATPAQSTPAIKYGLSIKHAIEIRIPAHFIDILNMAVQKIDPSLNETFYKTIILYYIQLFHSQKKNGHELKSFLNLDIAKAKASKRLSLKINGKQHAIFQEVLEQYGFSQQSDFIKMIIIAIYYDILCEHDKVIIQKLRKFSFIF